MGADEAGLTEPCWACAGPPATEWMGDSFLCEDCAEDLWQSYSEACIKSDMRILESGWEVDNPF